MRKQRRTKKRRTRKRGNGEGSIFRRADGRWVASLTLGYNETGHQDRKDFYGRTRSEVLAKLDDARNKLADGCPISPEKQTVGQFLARWLADVQKPNISAKSYRTYSDLIRMHLTPALGAIDLQQLTPQHVQHFINVKTEAKDDNGFTCFSSRTIKHFRDCLRAALNVAMQWNLIVRNPAALVKLPRLVRHKVQTYNRAQALLFVEAIRGHRLEALFLLALCRGMREAEVLGLGLEDLDMENKLINVRNSLQRVNRTLQLVATKTEESQRQIKLPDMVVSSLAAHLALREKERAFAGSDWVETGRLFTTRRGTMLDARNMLRDYYKLRDVAALPKIRFHDLRHSAATLLHAAGVRMSAISKLLGHSSTRTTQEVYTHVNTDMDSQAAAKMDELLGPPPMKTKAKKPARAVN